MASVEPLDHFFHAGVNRSVGAGEAAAALVDSQREAVEIRLGAELAATVTAAVEPAVELEMNVLRKFSAAQFALVRFFPRVQAQVCFQVAGAAETLVTNRAFMWFLSRMDQVMLLEVGQLGEVLFTQVTLERPFPAVHSEMDLEIRQLSEGLHANVTFVFNLPVLLRQGVRERFVSRAVTWRWVTFGRGQAQIHGFVAARGRVLWGLMLAVGFGDWGELWGGWSSSGG